MTTPEDAVTAAGAAYAAGLERQAARTPQDAARAALPRGTDEQLRVLAEQFAAERADARAPVDE